MPEVLEGSLSLQPGTPAGKRLSCSAPVPPTVQRGVEGNTDAAGPCPHLWDCVSPMKGFLFLPPKLPDPRQIFVKSFFF